MPKRNNVLRIVVAVCSGYSIVSCTSLPLLVPNPPSIQKKEIVIDTPAVENSAQPTQEPPIFKRETIRQSTAPAGNAPEKPGAEAGREVDFSFALPDTGARDTATLQKTEASAAAIPGAETVKPDVIGDLPVSRRMIRISLFQSRTTLAIYSMDTTDICAASQPARGPWFRGSMTMTAKGRGSVAIAIGNGPAHEAALPCTLVARDESDLIDLGGENYRGSIIITGGEKLSVINYLDVEDYLRGVVPLEIGNPGKGASDALKAQAVTARTYAYKRMSAHDTEPFDVVGTIADQVYRGADAETPEADLAVRSTKDLVLVWQGALADVYYHSTCGGETADISGVWGRAPCSYLGSVNDSGPSGTAWCSGSKLFTWEAHWTADQLSKILRTTVKATFPGETFAGVLQDIAVRARFGCGRIKDCELKGSEGSVVCGGDRVRFVLRKKSATGEILRSANFTVTKNGPDEFILRGRGYGHGVGMCQMGAIGRATAGQSFRQILAAYFPAVEIRRVAAEDGSW